VLTLHPRQETGYQPLEQGQVIEINPNCMKVNFGFRFIRGVLTGFVLSMISLRFFGELALMSGLQPTIDFILRHSSFLPYIAVIALLELYLWPSAPPMIIDRVNRRVIFQVLFRTKVIAWDDCVASIQHFVQASTSSASQGYNLRIEGNVINGKLGQKPQRAAALIHQSGISEDLLNYWEYIRHYMEGGPEGVPAPSGIHKINPLWAALLAFHSNIPDPTSNLKELSQGKNGAKGILKNSLILLGTLFLLLMTPIVYPLLLPIYIAGRTGRVRRYPKEIMRFCKEGQALAKAQVNKTTQRKPVIRVNGKLIDSD
jgi:hypothetical protein